jgi:hypothetical protein
MRKAFTFNFKNYVQLKNKCFRKITIFRVFGILSGMRDEALISGTIPEFPERLVTLLRLVTQFFVKLSNIKCHKYPFSCCFMRADKRDFTKRSSPMRTRIQYNALCVTLASLSLFFFAQHSKCKSAIRRKTVGSI